MTRFSILFTAFVSLIGAAASSPAQPLQHADRSSIYPDVSDTTRATKELVQILHDYYIAKSIHDADAWLNSFNVSKTYYADAALGWLFDPSIAEAALRSAVESWTSPDAISYPLRIIGDTESAAVFFKTSQATFGTEIIGVAALDFENGKVVRQVDYWDGRHTALIEQRVPDSQYPQTFGESAIQTPRNTFIQGVVDGLHASLSGPNATAASLSFSVDAIFEDRAARTRIEGQPAIERYLNRAGRVLPYAFNSTVRHVVGNAQGGGYEFIGGACAIAQNGFVAIEIDADGKVTRLTATWDASQVIDSDMEKLTGLAIEV